MEALNDLKTTSKRKPRRRLSNIRPKEVSLVDVAANEREFLLLKRKNGGGKPMNDKEMELFDSVVAEVKEDFVNKEENNEVEVVKIAAEAKQALLELTRDTVERLMAASQFIEQLPVMGEEESAGMEMNKALPAEVADELKGIMTSLMKILTSGVSTEKNETNIEEEVDKAGRKMANAKLTKLKNAVKTLMDLINEVEQGGSEVTKSEQTGTSEPTVTEVSKQATETTTEVVAETVKTETPVVKTETEVKTEAVAAPVAEATTEIADGNKEEVVTKSAVQSMINEAVNKAVSSSQEKIQTLEATVEKLKNEPATSNAAETNANEEVVAKNQKGFWEGVL